MLRLKTECGKAQ